MLSIAAFGSDQPNDISPMQPGKFFVSAEGVDCVKMLRPGIFFIASVTAYYECRGFAEVKGRISNTG